MLNTKYDDTVWSWIDGSDMDYDSWNRPLAVNGSTQPLDNPNNFNDSEFCACTNYQMENKLTTHPGAFPGGWADINCIEPNEDSIVSAFICEIEEPSATTLPLGKLPNNWIPP